MKPFLSIIIPAYNEESRLPDTLEQVFHFLGKQSFESDVIVVENGSTDRTFDVAQKFAEQHKSLRVIHNEERGKGSAVQRGVREASGKYVFICDADLSMPVEEISKFLPPVLQDFETRNALSVTSWTSELVLASPGDAGAEPRHRHLIH